MNSLYRILSLLLFLILFALRPGQVSACNCAGTTTVKVAVQASDIVFKGIVIAKERTADLSKYGVLITGDTSAFGYAWTRTPVHVVRIKVERLYKGSGDADTLVIITPANGAGCGFRFLVGQSYIVYGTARDIALPRDKVKQTATSNTTYWTNLCSRTTEWYKPEEEEIIAVLNLPR